MARNNKRTKNSVTKIAKTKIERIDGIPVDVYFALLSIDEAKKIKKPQWQFDWLDEFRHNDRKIYKMCVEETNKIEGLMSLTVHSNYVFIEDGEKPDYETNRDYKDIASAFIAFACKLSLENNGGGYVGFKPKTRLIDYYSKIGAVMLPGGKMAIFEQRAQQLINKYYENNPRPPRT